MVRRGNNNFMLVFAVICGVVAFLLTFRMFNPEKQGMVTSEQGQLPQFVTMVKDVRIGSMIRKEDLQLMPVTGSVNPKTLFTDSGQVVGKVARRNLLKGEPVKQTDLLAEGDNLASLIPKGYRAMTVPVNLGSNISDLLNIGSRVDVILTYKATKDEIMSVTLVENVRVIGIASAKSQGAGQPSRSAQVDISLAVTPDGAETLAYASNRGTLHVSIRSLSEEDEEKFFTLKELFFPKSSEDSKTAALDKPKVPKDMVEIIRGVRKESYATRFE